MKIMVRSGRLIRLETLPVTSCDDCGACCRHMGTPPGYAMFYAIGGIPDYAKESPDYERWLALPPDVEAGLRDYYEGMIAGRLMDRTRNCVTDEEIADAVKSGRLEWAGWKIHKAANNPIPCLWYDEAAKRCRHYEHRPETCREAVVPGDEACLATRRAFRIPLPVANGVTR